MRVGELARRTGTTIRALRYYESAGLVVPRRLGNGYREYEPVAERLVSQIRELTALGLTVEQTRPFVESIAAGADEAAVRGAALAAYRSTVDGLQERIRKLTAQRDALDARLISADRPAPGRPPGTLTGARLPALPFYATDGHPVDLGALGPGRSVLFVLPLTGRAELDLPAGPLEIPGARGGSEQAAWFRDHHAELRTAGAARVYGLSAQPAGYLRELAHRLRLPYPLIPDPRLTLIVDRDLVEHVFHPIPEPASHPHEVLRWLTKRAARTRGRSPAARR